ncbi:Ras-responsive element-binding protein 1, partial [Pseudolycoriella hygida]
MVKTKSKPLSVTTGQRSSKRKIIDDDGTSMKRRIKTIKTKNIVKKQLMRQQDLSIIKRGASETSDEDAKRNEFFAYLGLQQKSTLESASFDATDSEPNKTLNQSDASDFAHDEEEVQDAFTEEFRKMKIRGKFPCKLCMKVFRNFWALKVHNRVHLGAAGLGPYRCNICPFSIHDKSALTKHMRAHNGDKPFECSHRDCALTPKGKCIRRLRNRHGKTTRVEVKRTIIHHAPEDSSCEDPVKKMQIYNATYDNDDVVTKERHSPLANLKDIANAETTKIHVESLDQLTKPTIDQAKELQQRSSPASQDHVNVVKSPQIVSHNPQQQIASSTKSTNLIHNSGPVKMVKKNGVLMPKQKQRRYRTEQPFACEHEHCASRFTLNSSMVRHIKQQHPEYWAQRQRNRHSIRRRGSGSNNSGQNIIPSEHPPQLPSQSIGSNPLISISDQVESAILTQQLKSRNEKPSDHFLSLQSRNDFDNGNTIPPQPD